MGSDLSDTLENEADEMCHAGSKEIRPLGNQTADYHEPEMSINELKCVQPCTNSLKSSGLLGGLSPSEMYS